MGKMKKWIFALAFIILFIFAVFFYWKNWKKPTPQTPSSNNKVLSAAEAPTATPRVWKQSTVINVDDIPIRISWAIIQPKDVELYSNLKEQKLSEEIKVNKNCSVLVNGGFYSEEKTHLGLFVSNFETISKPIKSALLNGFLLINSDNKVIISSKSPNITPRFGLQSGPLFMREGLPLPLAIKNDEPSRRIVAGITADDQLIFLAFYRDQADLQGPLLGQLPEIINLFEKQTGIEITNAINLDGGSHSLFISNYDLLRESAIVGSYFCVK